MTWKTTVCVTVITALATVTTVRATAIIVDVIGAHVIARGARATATMTAKFSQTPT